MLDKITHLCVKVSYLCNNKCGFCWQEHRAAGAEMSETVLKRTKELIRLGNLKVVQMGGGEVFLWKPAKDFIQYLQHYNPDVKINLITNGSLFNDYWFSKAEEGLFCTMNLSINGPDEELYNKVSGRRNFYKVKSNLERIGEIKKRTPFYLQTSFVMTKPLLGSIHKYIDLVAGHADVLYIREMRPNRTDNTFFRENCINLQERKKLVPELLEARRLASERNLKFDISQFSLEHGEEPDLSSYYLTGYEKNLDKCLHMHHELQINNNGQVRLGCNFSGIILGNLNTTDWNGLFNNSHKTKIHAEAETGNFLACPVKLSRFGCTYALKQIGGLKGADRYIKEMPDFVFPRETLSLMYDVTDTYITSLNFTYEIMKNAKLSTAESGTGLFTPILLMLSEKYQALAPFADDEFMEEMEYYFQNNKIEHIGYTREEQRNTYDLSVINPNSGLREAYEILSRTACGGLVIVHMSTQHSMENSLLLEYLTMSQEWVAEESFGFLASVFRKLPQASQAADASEKTFALQVNTINTDYNKRISVRNRYYVSAKFFTIYIIAELKKIKFQGADRVALYGTGGHTEWLESIYSHYKPYKDYFPQITALIDDNPDGDRTLFGLKAVSPADFQPDSADAVILSSDLHQKAMLKNFSKIFGSRLPVIDLYKHMPQGPYPVMQSIL